MLTRRNELIVVGIIVILAILTLFLWIPNDVETGIYYSHRRQTYIGDSFIPSISVGFILILALIQGFVTWQSKPDQTDVDAASEPTSVWFIARIALVLFVSILVMFWAGPLAVWLFKGTGEDAETYRQLRSTMPWNIIGYFIGGIMMLQGLMMTVATRFDRLQLICSVVAVVVLIIIFEGPFDNLLLPPNGDW